MRTDGLRIDPKARPYGMQAIDLLVELVQGTVVELDEAPSEHGARVLAAMGVRAKVRAKGVSECKSHSLLIR